VFKIVALAYYIVAGHAIDEPMSFTNKMSFKSLDQCQTYLLSDQFEQERALLQRVLAAHPRIPIPDTDDVGPTPSVAITASCLEDDRV
jgi:hypothetical protein